MKKYIVIILFMLPFLANGQTKYVGIDTLNVSIAFENSHNVSYWNIGVDMIDSTKETPDTIYSVKGNKVFMDIKTVFQNSEHQWWSNTTKFEYDGKVWLFCGGSIQKEQDQIFFNGGKGITSSGTLYNFQNTRSNDLIMLTPVLSPFKPSKKHKK